MSLVKCNNCGHPISDKAKKCPHCGMVQIPLFVANVVMWLIVHI